MDQSVDDPGEATDGPETAEPAAAAPELAGPVSEESAELYFLIANFLTNASQCSRAAAVLRQELREKNLLGTAYNWEGHARPASFDDVHRRHQALPADQLARVTAQYLRQQQAVAAATDTSTSGGGGGSGSGDSAGGGSSSGTAIVVQEQPPPLTGPGVSRSLLSRVDPFSEDREANERARTRCAARVVEACIESVRVRASARKVYSDLATVKSKLEALELDAAREARAIGSAAGSATRGRCRAALVPGQESQAELTRLALRRQREELLAREVVLPEEVTLAEDEKDAALAEARQRGAMHNSLTRYAGKAVPTILSNRRAGGARFGGGRIAGRVPLRGASSRLLDDRMRPLVTANGHGVHPVFCIKFDRTGQYIFTGADDALVKVWSVTSGRLMLCLRGHASVITDMDVSPDNSMLVTSSDDRNMRVWDPRTGATLTVLRGHTAAVNLVRFAPGDSVAMSASEDGTCRVWDLRGQDSLATEDVVPIVLPHTNEQGGMIPVMCLSVSPAGNLIAAGCSDGAVRVWAYGDSDDDAAWGTGKHNTRRTGRDTIGRGEVYRSEAPRRSIPPTVAAAAAAATVPVPVASGGGAQAEVPPAVPPPAMIPPDAVPEGGATAAVAFGLAGGESGGANGAAAAVAAGGGGTAALQPQLAPWEGASGVGAAVNGPWGGGLGPGQAPPPPRPPPPPAPPAAAGEGRERRGRSANRGSGGGGGDGDGGVLEVRLATKLFGHVSGITDARFSGLGDRILTASMEDGTARVYSWGPRFSNVKHVVLKVCRQDTAAAGRARGGGRARAGGAGKKSTLDDACWSCDDDIIVTTEKAPALTGAAASRSQEEATSQFKVWSSETGVLLHTVKDAHANTVSALIPHPYDPTRLASVGAEGTVCTWDVGRGGGRRVRAFENILAAGPQSEQLHHGMSVAVLDGVFSPDGNSIAVADVVGRWTLYGTGHRTDETVAGKKVPLEQYFTSDYRELLRDERHNVVDAFTQQPPHLAQTGLLVDHIGNAYPEDAQPNTSELKGPLPLAPGVVTQRLRAVQAIAADLAKALAAKEARSSNARGVGVPQHLSNGAGGARRWQEVQEADAAAKAIAGGGGGGGSRRKGGNGGSGGAAAAAGGGGAWSGGRSRGGSTARQRGFYTDPGEDEIYLDVSDEDGDYDAEDPDSEYDDAPRGRRAGGGGGSRRRANEPLSREERARRRQQALLERTTGGGSGSGARSRAGARGRGAGRNNGGGVVSSLSSDEEEEEDVEEDEDDMDEGGAGSRSSGRRAGGKRKGKGKGRARGRRGGGGSGSGELPVIPDEFNQSVVAADSDEEIEQWPTGAEATGPGGRSTRGADRAAAEAAIAAAGGVLKVDRGTLKCALCHGGHTRERPLPGKIVGPHPLMDGASQLWVHDWCALYSPMVCRDDRTDALCNITSEIKRGRKMNCTTCKRRGATIGCLVESCKNSYHFPCAEATGWPFSTTQVAFHCKRCRKRLGSRGAGGERGAGGGDGEEDMVWRFPTPADRDWLTLDDPVKAMQHGYCPQVGEVVMYFPQGHEAYLRTFPENQAPPYKFFKGQPSVVKCQVKEMSFVFPKDTEEVGNHSVVCRLSLEVLGFPVRVSSSVVARTALNQASRGENPLAYREDSFAPPPAEDGGGSGEAHSQTFSVSLRDCGEADFLVSERRYNESVGRNWRPSERVMMEWKEGEDGEEGEGVLKPYFGVMVRLGMAGAGGGGGAQASSRNDWPNSPWDCLSIRWDLDNTISSLGPWEPRPVTWDESGDPPAVEPASLRACIPRDLRDSLTAKVREVAESPDAALFAEPVDVADYHTIVPVPMDLGLILRRLEKDYYCSVEALEFDCNLVYDNCTKYNEPGSDIVKLAFTVSDQLVQAIKAISEPGSGGAGGGGGDAVVGRPSSVAANGSGGGGSGRNEGGGGAASAGPQRSRQGSGSGGGASGARRGGYEEDEEEEGEEEGGGLIRQGKRKRARTERGRSYSGGSSASAAAAATTTAPVRESDRRRRSTSKASFSYASDSEEAEEEEEVEEEGDAPSAVVGFAAGRASSRAEQPASAAAGDPPNGAVRGARENGEGVGVPNGAGGEGANGVAAVAPAPERPISDLINGMLEHQKDVLARHGKLGVILRLARERWQSPPPPVDANLSALTEHLLGILGAIDEEGWFAEPVSEAAAPGYISAILRPMDLGTVRGRLEGRRYRDVSELQDDLLLVVANCFTYNSPGTMFEAAATSLAEQASGAYAQALAAASATNGWGLSGGGGGGGGGAAAGAGAAAAAPVRVEKRKRGRPRKNKIG